MPYIFSAQEAGMLAAGLTDDSHHRETQRLLTLVECAVRSACSKKKNSVELLAPDFRGWDKNNIKTLSPCAGEVLDALSKAGYHFYTCHLVKLGSEYGEAVEIPYTHTVVTWPQVQVPLGGSTGVAVTGSEEGDLALAEGMNKKHEPGCPVQPVPPPNPSQLLSKLRQEGYTLHGYNNDTERDGPRPPCSPLALSLIYRITDALETAHKKRHVEVSYPCPKNSLKCNDMMYVLQTFSLRGFEIKYDLEGGFFKANWKTDAWDWNEGPKLPTLAHPTPPDSSPVQFELCGTERGEHPEIGTIDTLLSLLGEQQVRLELGLRMQQPGFRARHNWGSPGEVALFQASLNGVYDAAMVGDNNFSTEFDLDVRAGELVKYFREVGFRVELSTVKGGDVFVQKITMSWVFL